MCEGRTIYEVPEKYGPLFPWVYKQEHEQLACVLTWSVLVPYVLMFGWKGVFKVTLFIVMEGTML